MLFLVMSTAENQESRDARRSSNQGISEIIGPSNIEVGDIVVWHGMHTGKVVGKFLSATGVEVYDIKLAYGPFRVAALGEHIVINYGPRSNFTWH